MKRNRWHEKKIDASEVHFNLAKTTPLSQLLECHFNKLGGERKVACFCEHSLLFETPGRWEINSCKSFDAGFHHLQGKPLGDAAAAS